MPYKDLFPTRDGTPSGAANERQMLDAVGAHGFRTKIEGNTMLRTRGGNPEFTTLMSGSGSELPKPELTCKFFLNTGIVDMHAGGPLSPQITDQGNIYQTDYVASVGAGIGVGNMQIKFDKDAKLTYLLNDAIPANGVTARSFTSEAGDYTSKKVASFRVPPSMFTGRMRLYVQSLYGGVNKTIKLASAGVTRPALSINTRAQEDAEIPAIIIGTGSGLFYDVTDRSHWLIFPDSESALIIRLKTNFCAERLRGKLADPALTIEENERIESYILSHSVPDLTVSAQEVFYDPTPSEAMGYSWHWNWDGDTCDIVAVVETMVEMGVWGFESTHYRLKFSRGEDGVFAVSRSIEDGPSLWSVPKNANVIAYPDWGIGDLIKAGNLPSGRNANQDGLVYCFYAKNDLKLVSYTGAYASHDANRDATPQYFGGLYWDTPKSLILNSFENGNTQGNSAWDGMSHTFRCDEVTVGGENGVHDSDNFVAEWAGRTLGVEIGLNQVVFSPQVFQIGLPTFSVTYNGAGTPSIASVEWSDSVTVPIAAYWRSHTYRDGYTLLSEYSSKINSAFSLVVIPFMDAQAVYLQGSTRERSVGTRHTGTRNRPTDPIYGHWRWERLPDSPYSDFYDKYTCGEILSGGEPADTSAAFDEVTTSLQPCTLISSHGTFTANPPDISPFYTAAKAVEQNWATVSSVNGVVYSKINEVEAGSPIFPDFYSLVGWA